MGEVMRKAMLLIVVFTMGITFLVCEYAYYKLSDEMSRLDKDKKERFSALIGLPDSSLVSEAHYVRHRSLSTPFAFFNEAPSLIEYFPSTFVYHYSPHVTTTIPSRIEHAR